MKFSMNKRYILLLSLVLCVLSVCAQSGGITTEMLREIQNVQPLSPADKAISNAIAANSIDALAKNRVNARALQNQHDSERDLDTTCSRKVYLERAAI